MEIITTHLHADFDSLSAMIAAQKLYPEAVMVFPGSQERNVRDFLSQSEHVYNFQRLKNIVLAEVSKLIVVDTREKSRIGKFNSCLTNPGLEIHIYDHHPKTQNSLSADYEVIKDVGSTTTILTQIFQEKGIKINADEATLMNLAIHEDTGSFTFDTTTPEDLLASSWLLKQQARPNAVSQFISQELSTQEIDLLHGLINAAQTYTIQGVDIVLTKINIADYVDEFALLVRKFMVMENLNALFALASMGDRIYFIARSRIPEVNVGKIAVEFGGGGHASAASSTIKDMTLIEAEENLLKLLHKYVQPKRVASELMSSPVISVPPDITINETNEILTRYSITVLPVLEDGKKILGIISRRVVEKAIFHGLGKLQAADYMSTDFAKLAPDAELAEIQEVIIENRQRFIPVVKDGIIKGVITRTDLLNLLIKDPAQTPVLANKGSQLSVERNRNLNNLMVTYLKKKMTMLLRTIGEVAEDKHYQAFAVGGFVRDLLRRTPNQDLDIVIEGDGIKFAKLLAKKIKAKVRHHEKFNTAVVQMSDGFKIDVATARLEYYEYPAAMPVVELSSIKLDLYRRDFTINALAINLNPDRFGILVDFFNCQNDIRDRQIRVLHNLSFVEDPTRIFRAIRFEQRMGFTLGNLTIKLIKNAVKMEMYGRFSGQRFFHELKLILAEENPLPAIYRLSKFDLLKFLHPSLKLDTRLKNILRETHRTLAWYKRLYLDEPYKEWQVFLLALTAKITAKQLFAFCGKFELPERLTSNLIKEKVAANKIIKILNKRPLASEHISVDDESNSASPTRQRKPLTVKGPPLRSSEVYWLLNGLSTVALLYLMGITTGRSGKKAVSIYVTHMRNVATIINGADLKEMGYKPGPLFATILNHLLEAKLDGIVHTRKDEKRFVRKYYPVFRE